jgi:trimethylguanosine synthase
VYPVLSILIERKNLSDSSAPVAAAAANGNAAAVHNDDDDEEVFQDDVAVNRRRPHDGTTAAATPPRTGPPAEPPAATNAAMNDNQQYHDRQQQPFWTSDDSNATLIAPYSYEEQSEDAAALSHHQNHHHHGLRLSMVRIDTRPTDDPYYYSDHNRNNNIAGEEVDCVVESSPLLPPPTSLPDNCQKYWHQRHHLFSRFDAGIRLDHEGWFSVTPEPIAHHVAAQVPMLVVDVVDVDGVAAVGPAPADHLNDHDDDGHDTNNIVVLDAFGGCGGNAIAFAQRPEIARLICVDLDRQKLRNAAHNAAIYGIPHHKMVFVECNVIFILQFCYRHGNFVLDAPLTNAADAMAMMAAMPPTVAPTERYEGYQIGGLDLLPRHIDVIFMDPPWGGVDYNAFGRSGYSLQDHMRIPRRHGHLQEQKAADAFFDSFAPTTEYERKAAFNCTLDETNGVSGSELLRLAAQAAHGARVIYDIPRNTNRHSLGEAALSAGYRGNIKLDEHYWHGRLKTVTAYFGKDWRNQSSVVPSSR